MGTDIRLNMTEDEKRALRNILDRHDATVYTSAQDGELVSEIEFYSDLGEDFIMSIFWDGTATGFAKSFLSYSEDFDPYEHACLYISMGYSERKRLQVPEDNAALIKDALKIKKTMRRIARELNRQFNAHYKKGAAK